MKQILVNSLLTVYDLVSIYISQITEVRHNTRTNYNFILNILAKEDFGKKRIGKVKPSEGNNS